MTSKFKQLLPVFSLLLSATIWGVIWYPLRLLENSGLSGLWLTAISYSAAAIPVFFYFYYRGQVGELGSSVGALLVLALAAGWCNLAFILAMLDGQVMRVLLLFYLSPVWTLLIGHILLGEQLNAFIIRVLGLAMLGALFMLWDGTGGLPWPESTADWLAISSGVTFALSNVMIRYLCDVSITGKTLVSWAGVVGLSLVGLLLLQESVPALEWQPLFGAVLLGWCGFLIATYALQYGVTRMPAQRSAVILLFELIAGGISANWLAGESLSAREWIGGVMILSAGYLVAVHGSSASDPVDRADEC